MLNQQLAKFITAGSAILLLPYSYTDLTSLFLTRRNTKYICAGLAILLLAHLVSTAPFAHQGSVIPHCLPFFLTKIEKRGKITCQRS